MLRVPAVLRGTKRKHPLLGAALFFVAPAAAEGRVEAEFIQRLAQRLRQHDVRICGAVGPRPDPGALAFLIGVHQEFQAEFLRGGVAEFQHLAEVPARGDLQQRKRWLGGRKGLARDMQHHRTVLAHGIQHHRSFTFRHHLAEDVNAFGFQPLQIIQGRHLL